MADPKYNRVSKKIFARKKNSEDKKAPISGGQRILATVYGIFAVSAFARAIYQILTDFSHAPVAYILSAFAAFTYILATIALSWKGKKWYIASIVLVTIEFIGVITVGTLSNTSPELFPVDSVWSHYGSGYGYIPLILPLIAYVVLWKNRVVLKS